MVTKRTKRDDLETLGGRLRMKRLEQGWTQEQLALKAATSQAVIQKIENGKSLRPRKIDVIARVLGVDPAWLMFAGNKPQGLDEASMEVAMAWSRLPESERMKYRDEIVRAAYGARRRRAR